MPSVEPVHGTPDRAIVECHGTSFSVETWVRTRHDTYNPTWNETGFGTVVTCYASYGFASSSHRRSYFIAVSLKAARVALVEPVAYPIDSVNRQGARVKVGGVEIGDGGSSVDRGSGIVLGIAKGSPRNGQGWCHVGLFYPQLIPIYTIIRKK